MTEDELARATQALRRRFDGRASGRRREATERRVLERTRPRRALWKGTWFVFPIAAALAASSAWGAMREVVAPLFSWVGRERTVRREAPSGSRDRAATAVASNGVKTEVVPLVSASPAPAVASSLPKELEPPVPRGGTRLPTTGPRAAFRAGAGETPAPEPTSASTSSAESVSRLYEEAHRLHFVEKSPAQALVAWEKYLTLAPHGALTLEARYNRAICLVRLDRRSEALTALEAFARGDYGDYRKREASALIAKLSGPSPTTTPAEPPSAPPH